jgi:hypothetical protein
MFHKKKTTPTFASDLHPTGKPCKKPKETYPQTLMNYEIIRDKVQNQFQSKYSPPMAESKKGKKKLIIFLK